MVSSNKAIVVILFAVELVLEVGPTQRSVKKLRYLRSASSSPREVAFVLRVFELQQRHLIPVEIDEDIWTVKVRNRRVWQEPFHVLKRPLEVVIARLSALDKVVVFERGKESLGSIKIRELVEGTFKVSLF